MNRGSFRVLEQALPEGDPRGAAVMFGHVFAQVSFVRNRNVACVAF